MGWGLVFIVVGLVFVGIAVYILITNYSLDSNNSEQRKEEVSGKYSPKMNRYAARKEYKAAAARSNLLDQLNTEQRLIDVEEDRQRERDLQEIRNQTEAARLLKEQKQYDLDQRLLNICIALDIPMNVYEKQKLNELDIQKLEAETMTKLKVGFIYKLGDFQQLTMLRSQLDELYKRRQEVLSSNEAEEVKKDILAQIAKDILALEKVTDERREGLLQANNGQDFSGSDSYSEH